VKFSFSHDKTCLFYFHVFPNSKSSLVPHIHFNIDKSDFIYFSDIESFLKLYLTLYFTTCCSTHLTDVI